MEQMSDAELVALIESEERNALGYGDGELNSDRERALNFYNQKPFGNEQAGRSQVVTSEVADTVEWILPALMKIFTSSDKAVEFEPERPEDDEGAKQATDVCNYVFYRRNPGFVILYSFFKDALLTKNGYVKVYYDKGEKKRKQLYRGITEDQLTMLVKAEGVEVLAGRSYPDPILSQMMTQQQQPQAQMGMAQAPVQQPPPMQIPQIPLLYDVQIQITEPYGKTCVDPLPPEEVLISKDLNSVDVKEANFIAHRCMKTISELREMGYEVDDLPTDTGYGGDQTPEYLARREFSEDQIIPDKIDHSMRKVWVTEAYVKVDFDGDGIAELRKVVKASHKLLDNEEVEVIPIAAITPTIMTHRHFGKSIADWVMDLQLLKSTTLRSTLDNMYLTNSPRQVVLADPNTDAPKANVSDLLNVTVGGIVREYVPNAVRPLTVPFMGQTGLEMLQYLDTVKDSRVGFTGQFSGLDPNALNKTASGAVLQQTNAMQKIEMIARIFAETGVKRIFQLMLHCLTEYGEGRPIAIRLRDKWVEYDPTQWDSSWDMTVNVGLGTGNKDQQLQHLQTIAQNQQLAVEAGGMGLILSPKNIYNTQIKIAENAGFKNTEDFWTDPGDKMPEPPPDPKAKALEQKAQLDSQAKQQDMQLQQQSADQEYAHKERMAQLDMAMKQQTAQFEQERATLQDQMKGEAEQIKAHMGKAEQMIEAFAEGMAQLRESRESKAQSGIGDGFALSETLRSAQEAVKTANDKSTSTVDAVKAEVAEITQAVKSVVEEVQALKKPRKRKIKAPSGKTYTVEDE